MTSEVRKLVSDFHTFGLRWPQIASDDLKLPFCFKFFITHKRQVSNFGFLASIDLGGQKNNFSV